MRRPVGPLCGNPVCPCAVPSDEPCELFHDYDDRWCAICGWEEHDHARRFDPSID